jgi:hypothetical protein
MKTITLTFITIITCFVANAQSHENQYDFQKEIRYQLKALEDESISKLKRRDKEEALKRIDKIYFLLDDLAKKEEQKSERRDRRKSPVIFPMEESSFKSLLSTVDNEMMPSDKIKVINISGTTNYFTMDQLVALLEKFTFDKDRLQVIENIYPRLVKVDNAHVLFNYLTFSSSKDQLEKIIKEGNDARLPAER